MNFVTRYRLDTLKSMREWKKRWRAVWPKFVAIPSKKSLTPPKDDKDFQRLMLKALNKPKKMRLLIILNSAFFLWILTAISLTATGSVLSRRSECVADFEKLQDKFEPLTNELSMRYTRIFKTIQSARSPMDLNKRSREGFHSDLARIPTFELRDRWNRLALKVDMRDSETTFSELINKVRLYLQDDKDASSEIAQALWDLYEDKDVEVTDEELPALKAVNERLSFSVTPGLLIALSPDCDLSKVVSTWFNGRHRTVAIVPTGGD